MTRFTEEERNKIIRGYLSPGGEDETFCPSCGQDLDFASRFLPGESTLQVRVLCPDCGGEFTWRQANAPRAWKPIHLQYFLERTRVGQVPRCPVDDCAIVRIEHSDEVFEFRCPFCNRRGTIRAQEVVDRRAPGPNGV